MTRRARHMLLVKVAIDALLSNGTLPSTKSLATVAQVHPATARRWRADLRQILGRKATDLRPVSP